MKLGDELQLKKSRGYFSVIKLILAFLIGLMVLGLLLWGLYQFSHPVHDWIHKALEFLSNKVHNWMKGALGAIVFLAVIWAVAMEGSKKK
jgi:succinate dehydrogenase/fumarate reductase cytochrome b subunit